MGNYSLKTQRVINDLMSSVELMRKNKKDEAQKVLDDMKVTVSNLKALSHRYCNQASEEGKLCQKQIEELEIQITALYEGQKNLEKTIRETRRQIDDAMRKEQLTREHIHNLRDQVDQLQRHIDELNQRSKELKKWWWVPGYGQYLAVRTLVDNDIGRHKSACEDLNRLCRELQKDDAEIREIQRVLSNLEREYSKADRERNELLQTRGDLDKRKKNYARNEVYLSNVSLFYGCLEQNLETVDRRLEDLEEVVTMLDKDTIVGEDSFGNDEVNSLKDALLKFAEYLDREEAKALSKGRFLKMNGDGLGICPFGYRLATKNDVMNSKNDAAQEMGHWDIARLADGWAFRGKGYGYDFKLERVTLGHTLLVLS